MRVAVHGGNRVIGGSGPGPICLTEGISILRSGAASSVSGQHRSSSRAASAEATSTLFGEERWKIIISRGQLSVN